MINKIAIPAILFIHSFGCLIYFHDLTIEKCNSWGWSVYFNCLPLLCLCLMSAFFSVSDKHTPYDKYFLLVESFFSISLLLAFELNYKGIITHTYGLIISSLGVALTTLMITFSLINYEFNIKK